MDTDTENQSGGADLRADTAVRPDGAAPGRYRAELPAHWNYFTPSGGVLMTVALRAMQAEVPDLRPISATALFCAPVPDGPLVVRVEVLRRGRVAAQLRAALSGAGAEGTGLEVSATFARDITGPAGTFLSPPADAATVKEARVSHAAPVPFLRNFEIRTALGRHFGPAPRTQPAEGDEGAAGVAASPGPRHARWYRYRVPPRLPDGRLDPLCLPPLADTMPPAVVMALGPQAPVFFAPSLDLTLHFLQDTRAEWLLCHCSCRHAGGGYATADVEIWDEDGRLLAFGTQMMLLRRAPASPG